MENIERKSVVLKYESNKEIERQVYEILIDTDEKVIALCGNDEVMLRRIANHHKDMATMAMNRIYHLKGYFNAPTFNDPETGMARTRPAI